MDALVRGAAEGLRRAGWPVAIVSEGRNLPWHIRRRYLGLPELAEDFICYLDGCVRRDGKVRFLTVPDYSGQGLKGLGWNRIEDMQVERAGDAGAEKVRAFWDAYFPVMMTDDGRFLALCLDNNSLDFGKVVRGSARHGATTVIAGSYAELLDTIGRIGSADLDAGIPAGPLAEFIHPAIAEAKAEKRTGFVGKLKGLFRR